MVGPIIIECFSEVLSQAKRNCSLLEAGKNSPQINNPIWVARPYQMSRRVLTVGTFMLCVWVSEFLGFAQGFIFFVYCIAFASPLLKSNVAAFNQIWDDVLTLPWRRHVVSLPSSIWERREEKRGGCHSNFNGRHIPPTHCCHWANERTHNSPHFLSSLLSFSSSLEGTKFKATYKYIYAVLNSKSQSSCVARRRASQRNSRHHQKSKPRSRAEGKEDFFFFSLSLLLKIHWMGSKCCTRGRRPSYCWII